MTDSLWQKLKRVMSTAVMLSTFVSLYWGIIWKGLFALAVASIHLWGDNNWYEQVLELINKLITGEDVDISREGAQYSVEPRDLKKYVPNER